MLERNNLRGDAFVERLSAVFCSCNLYIVFQGRYDKVESLCRRSLAIMGNKGDHDHSEVVTANLNTMADVLQAQVTLEQGLIIYVYNLESCCRNASHSPSSEKAVL